MSTAPTLEECIEWLEQQSRMEWLPATQTKIHAILAHLRTPSAQDGPVTENSAPVPLNEDQAVAMNLVSHSWLVSNAPHRLRPAPASTAEVEAMEYGAQELHLRGDFCEMAADKRNWHSRATTLRNLAARLKGK